MNLKEGLGIVDWQSRFGTAQNIDQGTVDVPFVSNAGRDIWCVGEELMDCWASEEDPRWHLLINMAQAVGVAIDRLQPAEIEDVSVGEPLWLFDGGAALPRLQTMLASADQKRVAWQWLCQQTWA